MLLPKVLVVALLILIGGQLLPLPLTRAEAPPADGGSGDMVRAKVARLLGDLDSDQYDKRQRAVAGLEALAAEPGVATFLSREFERVLVLPNTSLEVRKQLERLQRRLPKVPVPPSDQVSGEEIDRLVRQLDDDSYGARVAATRRLEWLLGNPKLAYPILSRLKQRISADNLAPGARQSLEPIYERARGAWLTSDPAYWNLPPVSPAEIGRWLDDLVASQPSRLGQDPRRAAEAAGRELRDVLARDAEAPKVKQTLEARLADKDLSPAGAAGLRELLGLTRPAMVAEYWEGRRHLNTQHLWIGVPSLSPGAQRPSHFDRIDDRVAHCVSGQSLSPGDYPVGVAIPHPKARTALFHLVNLSTPRLRMAYAYQSRREETVRLAELSRRSLDRFLARKAPLAERELEVLEQFDAHEVSRFAGKFVQAVDDQPLPVDGADPFAAAQRDALHPSRHGEICAILAGEGTQEAIPGLLQAIETKRFLPPTPAAPYQLPWIAALAIALRDPWPDVDGWLLGLIGRNDPLVLGRAHSPELGATAAAILLKHYQQEAIRFGLEPAPDETFQLLDLPGYRFPTPESRQRVRQWWSERKKST